MSSIKNRLRRIVKSAVHSTGYEISKVEKVLSSEHGQIFTANLSGSVDTVFDVGANVGQSLRKFRGLFPKAQIHSFEPVGRAFEQMSAVAAGDARAHAYKLALGPAPSRMTIQVAPNLLGSSLVAHRDGGETETIEVDTLDRVCERTGVQKIDFMKIDVEGFELEVFKGAERMLGNAAIGMVFAEVGLRDDNPKHVHFGALYQALHLWGFRSFGLYDIKYWVGKPFANALFIHESRAK